MAAVDEIERDLLAFSQREIFAPEVGLEVETDLLAAGFDSMSLVRMLVHIEWTYGIWIPEREISATTLRNLRAVAATVSRLLHGQ